LPTWRSWASATPLSLSTDKIIGGEIIRTGLLAGFVATADLTNGNYARRIIPV